uniref:Uncharacterized protein n=1 Tax=Panagrolaimus sp. ES5 TaxID=591445 RepID=A0AC34GJE1_9BILA
MFSENVSLSFETKEAHNSEDYPEGFADGFGKGAIEGDSGKRLSKVESWPETMEPLKSDKDEYVSEEKENDGFLYLPNDYVGDPSNIKGELVALPSIDLY